MDRVGAVAGELGYDRISGTLLRSWDQGVDHHPFAPELRAIFNDDVVGSAAAVFCLDRVPTVCLLERSELPRDEVTKRAAVRALCERLWNQNLSRLVLVASEDTVEAWSVDNPDVEPEQSSRGETSDWTFHSLMTGRALQGRDAWFDPARRVDRHLIENVTDLVDCLRQHGLSGSTARRLIARIIFVAYLEDRGIVGEAYRESRKVKPLIDLIGERDGRKLGGLFVKLRDDFNGDFLVTDESETGWASLPRGAFQPLHDFLSQTTLRTGQKSFWRYDFSHIPIELIASIYETFLAHKDEEDGRTPSATPAGSKRRHGAYYTPRVLADWVLDLALEGRDILRERIHDPACGSGMLLTAAYRRLIRAYESAGLQAGRSAIATFDERKRLLLSSISGADVDEDACQLTSFSLYLALLADLSPPDLATLRAGGHKLPSLKKNIRRGDEGDFFKRDIEAEKDRCTLLLSNPPWRALRTGEPAEQGMRAWRLRQPDPKPRIPKNQIAAAFALGSADLMRRGGRVALILPIGLLVSNDKAQRDFRAHLIGRYKVRQIVNFSDMRRLIFADAVHPFAVLFADVRETGGRFADVESERFEYWTPKADMSLALGRLAVHGADRADMPMEALIDQAPQLGMRYWGTQRDTALLATLRRHGRLGDLLDRGWEHAKGFHAKDEDARRHPSRWYEDVPDWMRQAPFLDARRLPADFPVVEDHSLQRFPLERIARALPERLFKGPRVIWPDGTHPANGVKAVYSDKAFSFQHSLAVLSAPDTPDGRRLARFLAIYLRSPLAIWLLLLLSSSVSGERPKLHLQEAMDWPFWHPENHPEPEKAAAILSRIGAIFDELEAADDFSRSRRWDELSETAFNQVYAYFGLTDAEVGQIEELVHFAGPAVQPSNLTFKSLSRPLRKEPSEELVAAYCDCLVDTLRRWRDTTGGVGEISAAPWIARSVPLGAAVISLDDEVSSRHDDGIATELLSTLNRLANARGEDLLSVPDLTLVENSRIYIVKPMIARFWLRRSAVEDAGNLALRLQSISAAEGTV